MERRQRKKQPQRDYLAMVQQMWSEQDFSSWVASLRQLWSELPQFHRYALAVLCPITLLLAIAPWPSTSTEGDGAVSSTPSRVEVELNITPQDSVNITPEARTKQSSEALVRSAWISYTVKQGDTLSQLFRANDLPMTDLTGLIAIEGEDKPLSNIRPGQLIRYKLNKARELDILQLEKSGESIMFFRLAEGGFGRSK
jgi:cell envelope opacity-associated protein A